MSFLGSIGHLMRGSGLQELLEVIYASNSVGHMLSGKAISRAVRGHLLVDAALNTMLVADLYNVPLPSNDEEQSLEVDVTCGEADVRATDLAEAQDIYESLLSDTVSVDEVCSSNVINKILSLMKEAKEAMTTRTSRLWLQYMDMIDILRMFLKAERTGNWELHLQAVHDMLPYFAASGHSLYAKSAYIYLQLMHDLPNSHTSCKIRILKKTRLSA